MQNRCESKEKTEVSLVYTEKNKYSKDKYAHHFERKLERIPNSADNTKQLSNIRSIEAKIFYSLSG